MIGPGQAGFPMVPPRRSYPGRQRQVWLSLHDLHAFLGVRICVSAFVTQCSDKPVQECELRVCLDCTPPEGRLGRGTMDQSLCRNRKNIFPHAFLADARLSVHMAFRAQAMLLHYDRRSGLASSSALEGARRISEGFELNPAGRRKSGPDAPDHNPATSPRRRPPVPPAGIPAG